MVVRWVPFKIFLEENPQSVGVVEKAKRNSPIKHCVVDAVDKTCHEPDHESVGGQVQQMTEHHDVEAVFLMVVVHSREKRVQVLNVIPTR